MKKLLSNKVYWFLKKNPVLLVNIMLYGILYAVQPTKLIAELNFWLLSVGSLIWYGAFINMFEAYRYEDRRNQKIETEGHYDPLADTYIDPQVVLRWGLFFVIVSLMNLGFYLNQVS